MTVTRRKPATYADLLALPPQLTGQIVDGELIAMPRPSTGHSAVTSELMFELTGPFGRGRGGPGGWVFRGEPELHLAGHVLVPDLAGWKKERYGTPPTDQKWLSVEPDWVCEVLSPSTASVDRVAKHRIYLSAGVRWEWFIDPLARVLEAFQNLDGRWTQLGSWDSTERPRVAPFDAFELDLAALWANEGPARE
jgi:Uma2 family endonuclease